MCVESNPQKARNLVSRQDCENPTIFTEGSYENRRLKRKDRGIGNQNTRFFGLTMNVKDLASK